MSDFDAEAWREMFGTDLFRPRDSFDADLPPGTLRGAALELRETTERLADYLRAWLIAWRSVKAFVRQGPHPARRPHRRKHAPSRRRTPVR